MHKIKGGWVLLSKKILNSGIYSKPPLYFKLWVWMIMKANFSDKGTLKRGQLFTTIEEMREEMSHMVGYRKVKPTVKEIRGAYEGLAKGDMIGTMKGTRGMVVTICKYDYYQDIKNYEGHNEGHDEGRGKGTLLDKEDERSIILKDGTFYNVSEQDFSFFKRTYPHVNLENELNKMKAWCYSNEKKRKTNSGMKKFVNGWLSKVPAVPVDKKLAKEMALLSGVQ